MGQNNGDAFVGGEAKMYYNSGSYGSPTWVENLNVGDLDGPDARTAVPVPTRGAWPNNVYIPGSRERALTWNSIKHKGTADVVLAYFLQCYENGTPIDLAITDGDITTPGTRGKRDYYIITKADQTEPLDGSVAIAFEAKPAANNGNNYVSPIVVT